MSTIALKGLKGLRNLASLTDTHTAVSQEERIQQLAIDSLIPGKYQPRKKIDDAALLELSHSIKSQGIIQPLVVRTSSDKYEIIAGERRWRAAKLAEINLVPAIVKEIDDSVALAFALIENIQREDLNPIEEALAFARFIDEFEMTHADVATMVGRSRTSVTNALRLLTLDNAVKDFLEEGVLDMGHARALLTFKPEKQLLLAQKIVEMGLTVRGAERMAQAMKCSSDVESALAAESTCTISSDRFEYWASALSKKLSSKVTVKFNVKGKGMVMIHVDSPDAVDWLIDHLDVS